MSPILSKTPKWILYKHTSSFEIVKQTAIELKAASQELGDKDRLELLHQLKDKGLYKPRNLAEPLDSIQHRINTLIYYMFGYREQHGGVNRFIFSPLGNLFFQHIEDETKLRKVLFSMLWGKQFPDPFFGTQGEFQLYPFRLLFKLMLDERIDYYLTPLDYAHCVSQVTETSIDSYEQLITNIQKFRKLAISEVEAVFNSNRHHYVNSFHEWQYTTKLLSDFGLIYVEEGQKEFRLLHGKSTQRWIKSDKSRIVESNFSFAKKLLNEHDFCELPITLNDPERLRIDAVKEVYSFVPNCLMSELGFSPSSVEYQLARLPKELSAAALNPHSGSPDEFELLLTEAMNLFSDVDARRISGPGNTDIECVYLQVRQKFAVEAKSTQTKLSYLNAGRLALHRSKISAQYTLVVTPKYSPSVITDIVDTPVVIVLVSTFVEYLYNALSSPSSILPYGDFDKLAHACLGGDMSEALSTLTMERFAVAENKMIEQDA